MMSRMHRTVAIVSLLVSLGSAFVVAQRAPATGPGVLAKLEGQWEGPGIILGQPSRLQIEWSRVLAGRFFRLTHTSRIGAEPNSRHFEGHAYYQAVADGRYRATWFDSTGLVRPIDAAGQEDELVAAWGTPETEVGETTYRLKGPDQMDVVDRVKQKDGAWREFGRSTLTRTSSSR